MGLNFSRRISCNKLPYHAFSSLKIKISTSLLPLMRLKDALVAAPEPSGPFIARYKTMVLTDESRTDLYAPHPRAWAVMTSAFYPVTKDQCNRTHPTRNVLPATAASMYQQYASDGVFNRTFERFRLEMCTSTSLLDDFQYPPAVLFSPDLGNHISYIT
jgi:hypothetical protein